MPRDFRCAVDVTASWCNQSGRRGDRKSLKHHMNWSLGAGTEASSGWRELELGIFSAARTTIYVPVPRVGNCLLVNDFKIFCGTSLLETA